MTSSLKAFLRDCGAVARPIFEAITVYGRPIQDQGGFGNNSNLLLI